MDTVLVVVVTALVLSFAGTGAGGKLSCTETENSQVDLPLDCPANHMIHVLQWLTAIGARGEVNQCQFHKDCYKSGDTDNNDFFPRCNGEAACTEQVDLKGKNYCSNGTKLPYVQVEYECIPDTWILNICDSASASASSLNASSLFVKSPTFGRNGIVVNQSCTCAVHGKDLTVKVLSLSLSDKGAISIENGGAVMWSVATITQQWNRDIAGLQGPGTSHVNITFHDHGSSGEDAWLRISGSEQNITILCGRGDDLRVTTVTPSTSAISTSNSFLSSISPPPTTPAPPTPTASNSTTETSLTTSAESPSPTTTGSGPVTSSTSNHSSSPEVPPVTTPDVSTHSTPASQHSNESCVNATCPLGATDSTSVADGLILDERTILIIAISASVGGVLLLILIIVVIVVCRRRRQRRRDDKLHRVPAPNGDLYTVCSKSPRKDSSSSSPATHKGRRHNNAAVAPYAWHDFHLPPDPPGGEGVGQAGERNSHLYWTLESQPQAPPSKGGNSKGDNQPLYWVVEPESDNLRRFLGEQRVWPTESPRDYKDVHPYAVADIYTQKGQRPAVGVPIKRYQSADTDLQFKPKDSSMGQTRLRNAHSYEKPTNKRNSLISSLLFFTNSTKQDAKKPADDDKDSAIGYSASDEAASENISSILRVREDFDPFAAQHSGDSDNSDGEMKHSSPRVRKVDGKRGKPAVGVVVASRPRPKVATVEVHSSQAERPSQPPPPPPQPDNSGRRDRRRYNTKPYEIVTLNNDVPVMSTLDEVGDDQDWQTVLNQRWDGGDDQQPWKAGLGQQWDNGNGQIMNGANGQCWDAGGGQRWEDTEDQNWENGTGHNWRDGDDKRWDTRDSQGWEGRVDQTWDTRGGQHWDQGSGQPLDSADGQLWEDRDSQPWSGEQGHLGEDTRWDGNTYPSEAAGEEQWGGSYRGGRTSSTDADTESNLDDDNFLYDDVLFEDDQSPDWEDSGLRVAAGDTSVTLPCPPGNGEREPGHVGTGLSKSGSTDRVGRDGSQASDTVAPKGEIVNLGNGEGEGGMLEAILHSQETWC